MATPSRLAFQRGIAVLCGPAIDNAAASGLGSVPAEWQEQRKARDGDMGFHVTFLTKADLQAVAARSREGSLQLPREAPVVDANNLASIADTAAWLVARAPGGLDWVDAGQGYAKDDGGEALFRVILWPAGAAARRDLGLEPHDFHISLGFRGHDVHGRCKGLSSLTTGAPDAAAAPRLAVAVRQLLEAGAGRDIDAEGAEALASAALAGARAHGDTATEVAALQALCLLCGRFKRHQDSIAHAAQLLELDQADEVGCRSKAFALMALQRYEEAWPALKALQGLVQGLPAGKERVAVEKWLATATEKCRERLGMGHALFPGPEDAATAQGDRDFEEAFHTAHSELKFPSTAHLKNLGAATRDDKLCDERRQSAFCGSGLLVSVEEKIDGANLGVSLDSASQWRMQARSKMVNWKTDSQFAGLELWLNEHSSTLCEILERNNDILFGEWCAFRHTVKYTRLPGYFLAFDIYDRRQSRFLSRRSFHTRLQRAKGLKIPAVPTVCPPRTFASVDEVEALLSRQSAFGDDFLEGVYLRIDEEAPADSPKESFLLDRCKLVRSEFQQSIDEGGSWRGGGKNQLDMEAVVSYPERSYPCASAGGLAVVQDEAARATSVPGGKYPSTPHLPFSPGVNPDDSKLADCTHLLSHEVVVTEKLDGGNCCVKGGCVYARTHAKPTTHESFSAVKQLVQSFPGDVIEGLEIFGENMQGVHSIEYGNLTSFFYLFAARRRGEWLAWDEVVALAEQLGLPTVPLLFRGRFESAAQLQCSLEEWAREPSAVGEAVTPEGFVIRGSGGFSDASFDARMAKYVRSGHIQTDDTWTRTWKKAQLGTALSPRPLRNSQVPDVLRERLCNPRERHKVTTAVLGDVELPRNFSFLLDDMAVSSTPKNRQQILAMAGMGISLVVTLTQESPLPPEWFEGTPIRNLFFPVPNYHPPTVPQCDEILAAIAGAVSSEHRVMVHCGGGKGRAGTVAACAILRYGSESVKKTLEREREAEFMPAFGAQSDDVLRHLRDVRPGSVETEQQERFIREFASTLWQRSTAGLEVTPPTIVEEERKAVPDTPEVAEDAAEAELPQSQSQGAKAKREEKEAAKRLKDTQKRAPKCIMMVGLAGSGKSTFSKALEASGPWVRANQDDLGRKACEALVKQQVPTMRQGKARIVVDRCNLTKAERAEWLDLLGGPPARDVVCVFFNFDVGQCKQRAAGRMDHPTIRSGGGGRIIEEQAKQLERPQASEGFAAVEVIQSFEQAEVLLRRYGASSAAGSGGPSAGGSSSVPIATSGRSSNGGTGGQRAEARGPVAQRMEDSTAQESIAIEEDEPPALPSELALWLRTSMIEELGEAEAQAMLTSVEVILAGAGEDPDALASAEEVLRDCGAVGCAQELQTRWLAAC